MAETNGKCAYCESKVRHIVSGDIEHIVPKSRRPDLTFAWDNLTLACPICNTSKGSHWEEAGPLLNPYVDDPEQHLYAVGYQVQSHPESARGVRTVRVLDLNRADLQERRKERIERLLRLTDAMGETHDAETKAALLAEVERETGDDREFSFVARAWVFGRLGGGRA